MTGTSDDKTSQTCDRCEDEIEKGHPLDAVVHTADFVCNGCLKETDTVVDL